ncbi:MAG: DUF3179 domain-containing protein [Calditrichaceae bacterium]
MRIFNIYHNSLRILLAGFLLLSCENVADSGSSQTRQTGDWLIPSGEVFDGGPGKDGIPALTTPPVVALDQISYLSDDDLVLLYQTGDEVRAYPHPILDWHEIINDDIEGTKFSVSYCPLTGSGIGLSREIKVNNAAQETTFGVSGLLYNTNLIMYDRLTDSYWSQMKFQSVHGELIGQEPDFILLIETTFGTLKKLYPDAEVVSNSTGVYSTSQYGRYPYGDYKSNDDRLLFPISPDDNRLPRKERVFGIIGETERRVYQFKHFSNGIQVISDELDGKSLVIAGNDDLNFITAYLAETNDGTKLTFTARLDDLPNIMEDNNGNVYDIFGRVVAGPDQGRQLRAPESYIAFWFAWGAFYPGIDIYE